MIERQAPVTAHTVRRPYSCGACGRSWCVFAPLGRFVIPGRCLFCGLLRVRVEAAMVLMPGGREEPAWRVEMRRRSA